MSRLPQLSAMELVRFPRSQGRWIYRERLYSA